MKKRSKMEERFSNVAMDFELNRQENVRHFASFLFSIGATLMEPKLIPGCRPRNAWTTSTSSRVIFHSNAFARTNIQGLSFQGEASEHYQLLAKSSNSGLLNDDNSILVYTDSLHGTWVNR